MTQIKPYRLTASQARHEICSGNLTVEQYALSLLSRINGRDPTVKAWAHLNPDLVVEQARNLDRIAPEDRGPLHGVAIAVKDVIYTKDMPTQHNSPIYDGSHPRVDAASVAILRQAGALILGKTTTTEFAATLKGPATCNPHDPTRTPGGSSSGSGAVVGDMQAPIALGTQTGGSTIRPGSYNGIYAMKPTWSSISREGQKLYSLILDTLGIYTRSVEDLQLLADVFHLEDDEMPDTNFDVAKSKFAVYKTMIWPSVGPGTESAMEKAVQLLRKHGALVEEIEFPMELQDLPEWHLTIMKADGRTAFLPYYRMAKQDMDPLLIDHVEDVWKVSHAAHLTAFDNISMARPKVDKILGNYAAVLVPSVPDEAPVGIASTGSAAFNGIWTVMRPLERVPLPSKKIN
ncbi:hypothetical protein G7Z17_g1426 [Cylindrodendrum hubeiense]|uniref:Amidase domain-containing protein n=1 Tax=Cylindrodendrum hubeiense TaxID=595255 RepID=A0A9P5LM41_9HYPO|nr:hypothetical protein G7Z17_g1426 [Cylindrodendrum hubeiense]